MAATKTPRPCTVVLTRNRFVTETWGVRQASLNRRSKQRCLDYADCSKNKASSASDTLAVSDRTNVS